MAGRRVWLVVVGLTLASAGGGCGAPPGEAAAASASAARTAVANGALLLDVRTPGEFASGHLAGAVNIPVEALADRVAEIAPGREVVVYCRSGRRSAQAAELLKGRGHAVIDIATMEAW